MERMKLFHHRLLRVISLNSNENLNAQTEPEVEMKPKLLLMGLRRSGKSSILNVVFHKLPPMDTLFLESTNKVSKLEISSFCDFEIWDFPGQIDLLDMSFDIKQIFGGCNALVFVIDAQDDFGNAINRLCHVINKAQNVNPQISFEIFIHKVDEPTDDRGIETKKEISQRISDDLKELELENIHISYHLTSIYDHSIFEAFSLVIQKLIRQLPILENLLNVLQSNSGLDKTFIFDVLSKIYIATDGSPVDIQSYELCSDMIDVVLDVSSLYVESNREKGKDNSSKWKGYSRSSSESINESTDEATESYSVIRLNNMVLFLKQLNSQLALVCLLREDNLNKRGLLDFNFRCFKEAFLEVYEFARYGIDHMSRKESNVSASVSEILSLQLNEIIERSKSPQSTALPSPNPSTNTSFFPAPQLNAQQALQIQYQQYIQSQQYMQAIAMNGNIPFPQQQQQQLQLQQQQLQFQQQQLQLQFQQLAQLQGKQTAPQKIQRRDYQ
ncbi:hypothetical protein HK096_003401 [Nowakowskiella sp. JEL0078]|nr:hypothetical protein HK096_003401 [Nowakowskiella sp. JEL0078]